MGFAIWLVPSTRDGQTLKYIMCAGVADKNDLPESSTSYPNFDPHITLASFPSSLATSLPNIRAAFPKRSSPVAVDFQSLEIGTHFFRSVFLTLAPTRELSDIHNQIHDRLEIKKNTPLYPHLSLAYVDDADALDGEREYFVRRLEDAGLVREDERRVSLKTATGDGWMSGFLATEVWVVDCDGPVEGWGSKVLDRFSLLG